MKTDELKDEAFITIDDHKVMVEFINILHFPLNELTHGMYKEGYKLNCLLKDVLEQSTEQVKRSI